MKKISIVILAIFLGGFTLTSHAQTSHAETLPQQDSVKDVSNEPQTAAEKRKAFLLPEYYTKFLGASFFTIATVEKEFEVAPMQILGLTFFYDFGDYIIGMEANKEGVVVQMNLRLFADMAETFIQDAIDYGYKHVGNGNNMNVSSDSGIYESNVKRYRKRTNHGSVYMEVATGGPNTFEYQIVIYIAKA